MCPELGVEFYNCGAVGERDHPSTANGSTEGANGVYTGIAKNEKNDKSPYNDA